MVMAVLPVLAVWQALEPEIKTHLRCDADCGDQTVAALESKKAIALTRCTQNLVNQQLDAPITSSSHSMCS